MSIENAVASTELKHLTRQFYSAKALIISQQETIKHYSQKDFETNERRIKALQYSLNSEREMNANLTAELAELENTNEGLHIRINKQKEVIASQYKRIAELEKERDALEETRKNLIWFTRDEIKGLDPEQTGFIDLRVMKLEQQAKGLAVFLLKADKKDLVFNSVSDLVIEACTQIAELRNQAKALRGE